MAQSVATILFQDEKVLLIKRRDIPVWVLPGGGVNPEETIEEAACREMEEETGYQVEIVRKIGVYTPKNRLAQVTHFYEVKRKGGFLKTGNETKELQFFPLNHLPQHLPPPYAHWIADAAARHPHVLQKEIAGVSYAVLFKLFIQHPLLVSRFLLTKIGIHLNS